MKLILPADEQANFAIADWAGKKLGVVIHAPFYAVGIAKSDDQPLSGAAVFNNYNGYQIDFTAYGPGAFTASVVRGLAQYVFHQLGCVRLSAQTKRSNVRTRKLLAKHFKFEGVARRHYGKEDALLYRMLAEECPWLERMNENSVTA